MLQAPAPSAVVVPRLVEPPRNRVTVLPASAVPVKVGVVTLVRLSVLELPLSLAAVRSGAAGAAGAAVSSVYEWLAPAVVFPAVSVVRVVSVLVPATRVTPLALQVLPDTVPVTQ